MKPKIKFIYVLLFSGLIPTLCVVIILTIASINLLSTVQVEEIYNSLENAVHSIELLYDRDKDADKYINMYKEQGIEMTVSLDGKRVSTSIVDDRGKAIVGTSVPSEVISIVEDKGETYSSNNVTINGEPYFGYYTPIFEDGRIAGSFFAGLPKSIVAKNIKALVTKILSYGILVLSLCIIITSVLSLRLRKPILSLSDFLKKLSEGDLSETHNYGSSIIEIQTLLDSASNLRESLSNIVSQVKDSTNQLRGTISDTQLESDSVSEGVSQVSNTVGEVAKVSSSMAEDVQATSTKVSVITDSIENIVRSIDNLRKCSNSLQLASVDVKESMESVKESSEMSASLSETINNKIEETSNVVSSINIAVDAIINISSQTNLLSLNASIEAARVGEVGNGFAVVADSIKSLSTESGNNAKDISELADNIISKVNESVKLVKDMSSIIISELNAVEEASSNIEELNKRIADSVKEIQNIETLVESIDKSKNTVIERMESLSAISQETAASSEEITSSVETMSVAILGVNNDIKNVKEHVDKLETSIGLFKQ